MGKCFINCKVLLIYETLYIHGERKIMKIHWLSPTLKKIKSDLKTIARHQKKCPKDNITKF